MCVFCNVERERLTERERERNAVTRMGVVGDVCRVDESGKKVRYLKKTGEALPSEAELRKMMEEKMEAESKKQEGADGAAADAVVDVEKKSDTA